VRFLLLNGIKSGTKGQLSLKVIKVKVLTKFDKTILKIIKLRKLLLNIEDIEQWIRLGDIALICSLISSYVSFWRKQKLKTSELYVMLRERQRIALLFESVRSMSYHFNCKELLE
jgi:hypothetical protein